MKNLVLVRSDMGDGGWSLHAPGSTNEGIASGDAICLLTGESEKDENSNWLRPNKDDYRAALERLDDFAVEDSISPSSAKSR